MNKKTKLQHNAAVDACHALWAVVSLLSAPEDQNSENILEDRQSPLWDARRSAADAAHKLKQYIDLPIDGLPSVSDVLFGLATADARAGVKRLDF